MKLAPIPFEATRVGKKSIEVRVNDLKRQEIRVGDSITFIETKNPNSQIEVRVLAIRNYSELSELVDKEDFLKTGGIYSDKMEWASHIDSLFSKDLQSLCGLIIIEIEKLN